MALESADDGEGEVTVSVTDKAGGMRPEVKKQKARRNPGRTEWRDASVWITLLLIFAIGFAAAYGIWMRTWRSDMAKEQSFYVSTALVRMRDVRARLEAFTERQNESSLAYFASSVARMEGSLAQIPRRGPVQWRAEIIGLADTMRTRTEAFAQEQLGSPDSAALASFADLLDPLNANLRALERALADTVIVADGKAPRLNLTPDVVSALEKAIADARASADALPPLPQAE